MSIDRVVEMSCVCAMMPAFNYRYSDRTGGSGHSKMPGAKLHVYCSICSTV